MEHDEKQLLKRLSELYDRAQEQYTAVFSHFLNSAEQDILVKSGLPHKLLGGYEFAERKVACFCSEYFNEEDIDPPIELLEVHPLSQKFADKLTHRDFLGALMSLGIKRETLGDIIINDNKGYIFCLESICEYIIESLVSVKHTSVACRKVQTLPSGAVEMPEVSYFTLASCRLDALISSVYGLSRSESQELIEHELVFVNSRTVTRASSEISDGSIVSVRGHGRFIFERITGETKRGRLRAEVRIFK